MYSAHASRGNDTSLPRGHRRAGGRVALALFLVLLGVYLLTTGGHFYATDEETMFALTESIVLDHSLALNAGAPGAPPLYSQYGPGQSVVAIPFYAAGETLVRLFPPEAYPWLTRVAVSWLNPIVTASSVALVFLAAAQLGYGQRAAIGVALAYGLGTMAWPHSKTFFAEPLTALALFGALVALLCAVRARHTGEHVARWFVLSGLAAGFAPAVKIQASLALPLLGLYALALVWQWRGSRLTLLVCWGAGALLPLALLGWYQATLFGSPLRSGYGNVWATFTTPFWTGFNGQLWSPGRGIIWYAPLTVLFPFGLWRMRRQHPCEALLCFALFAAHILFYATWWAWDGAGAWGPRFLNTVLPFVALPLVAVFASMRERRWLRVVVVALAVATVPVQLGGLSVNLNAFLSLARSRHASYSQIADSAIVGHLELAGDYFERFYKLNIAPNSLALHDGFSYSEGGDAPLPRWTLPVARFALRPGAGQRLMLTLRLTNCSVRPTPGLVRLQLANGVTLFDEQPCPGRTYHMLLPPRATTLVLVSAPFDIAAPSGDRDGPLGALLLAASASVDGRTLTVQGDPIPATAMPYGNVSLRGWMNDRRVAHWDFWWYYLAHNRFPAATNSAFGAAWLVAALGLISTGAWVFKRRASSKTV